MSTGNVNLKIGSGIAYNVVGGVFIGNSPQLQTVKTLDGVYYTTSTYNIAAGPILNVNVSEITDFVSTVNIVGNKQTVKMTNNGLSILNVSDIIYSYSNEVTPKLYFSSTATVLNGNTISITPGNTATFEIAYIGSVAGAYNNYFVIVSDIVGTYFKVNTHQVVQETQGIILSPGSVNTTTSYSGQYRDIVYSIVPVFNEVTSDVPVSFTTSLSGSQAWSVHSTDVNSFTLRFNSWEVNNVNGTYVSTLTVVANGITTSTVNTATININATLNKNLGIWTSPLSNHNSVIGISYDLENGNRVLTIGVGMGGDNSPIVEDGFDYGSVYNLGLGSGDLLDPYPTWADVCKITFTGAAQTYYSGDHKVKTTETYDYMKYFGDYSEPGSMFIINDDGYGSITIELNHLREISGDAAFDVTLQNLTRAFHYYSTVDVLDRLPLQSIEYSAPIDDYTTYLFTGFNYNTRDKVALVNTAIVPLPT